MKVCIPIDFQTQGGGFYFLQSFSQHLVKQGWQITSDLADGADVLFTNHWMVSASQVLRAIRHNPDIRVVQRIDGAAQDYGRRDNADARQRQVNLLADLTIFQSCYCRYSTREKFPVILHDGPIIHNPVDIDCFSPEGPRPSFPEAVRVACVTWSTNPMKGARQIYAVAKANPQIGFVLCGRYPDAPTLPNLHTMGVLDRDSLPRALRACQVLLTFSQNEACPNHVLEGMATGLPVLYHDSGATSELVGDCGLAVTIDNFSVQLDSIMSNWSEWSARTRNRACANFQPQQIFSQYLAAIGEAVQSPPQLARRQRLWHAWTDPFTHPLRFARQWLS